MNRTLLKSLSIFLGILLICATMGCSKKEEAPASVSLEVPQPAPTQNVTEQKVEPPAVSIPEAVEKTVRAPEKKVDKVKKAPKVNKNVNVVVSVDGVKLKKSDLSQQIQTRMDLYKDKIPADKIKEVEEGLKKQLTEEFIVKTVLNNEVDKRKIEATKEDIQTAMDQIKENIPSEKKIEDFLKENSLTMKDIELGIRIKKMVESEGGEKLKTTEKDIEKFYNDNIDKFTTPETVHVRHILVTIDPKDDEKIKAEKKAKIDDLRKQIVEGADFAEVASKNSDCPSKENGGDLGEIKKGQTVQPFEEAAFSQEVNAIGPVVSTEFGHHIIQVLKHNPGKTVKIEEVKDRIAQYLDKQKHTEMFNKLLEDLRKKAKIVFYEKS